jgi:hypothetical protein
MIFEEGMRQQGALSAVTSGPWILASSRCKQPPFPDHAKSLTFPIASRPIARGH